MGKKNLQILSIVSPFFSCHHPFLCFILQFTFLPSPLPCSSFFIQCYAPPPSFPGLSCYRRFFFASPPEHCIHAPPSLATSTQVKASNSFTLLFILAKKQNIFLPSSVILEVLHPWSALLLHKPAHTSCMHPPPPHLSFTVPSSTSSPDLSSLSTAQLLSSWAHSVVGVRVDWPESASWAPSSLSDPLPPSASASVPYSHLCSRSPIHLCPALGVSSLENI